MRHTVVTLLKSTILLFIVINAVVKVSRHSNLDVDQTKSTGKVIKCLVVITYITLVQEISSALLIYYYDCVQVMTMTITITANTLLY